MSQTRTVAVKYVFLDIIGFSHGRTVEAQSDIIGVMNNIVQTTLKELKIPGDNKILIPTGDGICIAIIDMTSDFDIHMRAAAKILELLHQYNSSQEDKMRQFHIRVGVNENTDNLIVDINGNDNVAGAGNSNDPYDDPSMFGHSIDDVKEWRVCSCILVKVDTWRDSMIVHAGWDSAMCESWCNWIGAYDWELYKMTGESPFYEKISYGKTTAGATAGAIVG